MRKETQIFAGLFYRHGVLLWWLFAVIMMFLLILFFTESIGLYYKATVITKTPRLLGDTLILMAPFWVLSRRYRGLILIPFWGLAFIFFVNSMYFRFFGDCFPPELLTEAGNAGATTVRDSVVSLIALTDSLYLLIPTVVTIIWCCRPIRLYVTSVSSSLQLRLVCLAICMIVFAGMQLLDSLTFQKAAKNNNDSAISLWQATDYRMFHPKGPAAAGHMASMQVSGITVYLFTELHGLFKNRDSMILSEKERESLKEFVDSESASIQSGNRAKNLVFFVVESLNAEAVGRQVGGQSITPVMDSLISSEGTISCLNVIPQIKQGVSSDGQLMYNLGVLPLSLGSTAGTIRYSAPLPSLAGQLTPSHSATAVFADDGKCWNKKKAFRDYGYKTIITSTDMTDLADGALIGADAAMVRKGLKLCETVSQPFFMQLLSVSTHYPFKDAAVECIDDEWDIEPTERNYLSCIKYFDTQLGEFIGGLKKLDILDNTIIVVASDHHINMNSGTQPIHPIVFIAANCGITERIGTPVAQVDVFPTVLDIMGVESKWRGVGRSMLGPRRGERDARQQSVSDSIIRSDFFR